MAEQPQAIKPVIEIYDLSSKRSLRDLPWWFFAIILIAIFVFVVISTNEIYNETFMFIKQGNGLLPNLDGTRQLAQGSLNLGGNAAPQGEKNTNRHKRYTQSGNHQP